MEHLNVCVTSQDLGGLREYWSFLDRRLFSRLDTALAPAVRRLETSLLRLYLVNAFQANQREKVKEFFDKLAAELHHQPEWKEWFGKKMLKIQACRSNF